MFNIFGKNNGLKKVKDTGRISSDCLRLNILVDIGNYYGISSGNQRISHSSVYNYLQELEQNLVRFNIRGRETTKVSANILLVAVNSIQEKSFTFAKLCRAYYGVTQKPPYCPQEFEDFSALISSKLGNSPKELDRGYIEDRLVIMISFRVIKYRLLSLDTKINVSGIREMFGRRFTIDSSYNLYVDLDRFVLEQGNKEITLRVFLKYVLHDCFLDNNNESVIKFFNKCTSRHSRLKDGRDLTLEQIREKARRGRC